MEMHVWHCSLQKMDKNRDGVVTLDEFILSCQEVECEVYFLCSDNKTFSTVTSTHTVHYN